jgi:hypothetical protein
LAGAWPAALVTIVMLGGGYVGEAGYSGLGAGFAVGMAGWAFILYEIFSGEAGQVKLRYAPPAVARAFVVRQLNGPTRDNYTFPPRDNYSDPPPPAVEG